MPELGGPTTQSGILYQNSIAALYLGRLCDAALRPDNQRVVRVRVETPDKVDDIVVTFADNHKAYIQAKESLRVGDVAWKKLWNNFGDQFKNGDFLRDEDRLVFQIGNLHQSFDELKELCQRAQSSQDYLEWQDRLTNTQKNILKKIEECVSPELLDQSTLFNLIKHIDITIWPLKHIEQDLVPNWIPRASTPTTILFRLFRDRVGGKSRIRGLFEAHELRKSLQEEDSSLQFFDPLDIEILKNSVKSCSSRLRLYKNTIANTGQHIDRSIVDEMVIWAKDSSDDTKNMAMLIDQAGMGKTVALRDMLDKLESQNVDVLAIKADHQLSGIKSLTDVQDRLELPQPINQIVGRLAKLGRVIVLVDQIDALSLSLAHDQKALDVTLDLVARLRQIPNVRILLSCRLFDRNSDPRLSQIELARQFTLKEFTSEQVSIILEHLNINYQNLAPSTQKLLCIPLHLNLFSLAFENHDNTPENITGISSLQELYSAIWQNVVLKQEPGAPPIADRTKTLHVLTNYMNREQTISAPQSIFYSESFVGIIPAVNWLASIGILVPGKTDWTFLHQTFFDYCYAREFVEQGGDIIKTVTASAQGLFVRPQLIQIITFLRGTRPTQYLRDFQKLLEISNLRYHLYDLLLRWFGSLQYPMEEEWVLAQRLLLNHQKRFQLLVRMYSNPGWFSFVAESFIPAWLESEEEIDNQVIPYLLSLVEIEQTKVINIMMPYLGRNEAWDRRLASVVSRIHQWQTKEAIDLLYLLTPYAKSVRFGKIGPQ